jgi:putative oxidoreductase
MGNDPMNDIFNLIGRLLLAQIFLISGLSKFGAWEGTQAYMAAMGVPGALLLAVVALEVLGGLALALGLFARPVALALAAFSLLAALLFHADFGDQNQLIHFMKNLAMAGGLLFVWLHGAGRLSLDNWLRETPARS